MQHLENKKVSRTGRVSIESFKGSYRLRWTLQGKTHNLTIGSISKESLKIAQTKSSQIDLDIALGQFDSTLVKYDSRKATQTTTAGKQPEHNLKTVWEQYKALMVGKVEATTQKTTWTQVDRCLASVSDPVLFNFNQASSLIVCLLGKYKAGTLSRVFDDLNAAFNLCNEIGTINETKNPYSALKKRGLIDSDGESGNRTREAFSNQDLETIWEAFKNNRYVPNKSQFPHSYYYPFVQFCTLTGCRPEEAIALTWDDIKHESNRVWVDFCKAFSKGVLKGTKTGEVRLFPVNDELKNYIESFPRIQNENNLIFPSVKGKYIDQHNFSSRRWRVIVTRLVADGAIERYLPCYNLRHGYITHLARLGVDVATIGRICGTSPEMIVSHYLSPNNDYIPPSLGITISL
ncbi:putative Phage integrase family protein [Planktothrix sp. PCC 11201]|uniref:tyrosine-type recombinase/integrase n=1 Tax=Planktothrix sp. PCC 11201 TaxID=1729650 RepID=UPI000924508F|nr:tyrosine-type recombinase/integrase [Planktothrix sp. PCC 11201]SKB14207.1 putative Phage integrase family protein [Planktothrix sp. PCC 11201]